MTSTEFVYCPKKLHVAINGEAYDDRLTREVLDNLLHQNILLRCYAQGQTAQELCDELGVARPYIEDAVNVLLRDELLTAGVCGRTSSSPAVRRRKRGWQCTMRTRTNCHARLSGS